MNEIPPGLDDGFSKLVHGYVVRALTAKDIQRAKNIEDLESWFFKEPRVYDCTGYLHPEDQMNMLQWACEGYNHQQVEEDVRFFIQYPELINRPCDLCRKWWYCHSSGKIVDRGDGQPLERHASAPPSCETDAGCAKGHWSDPYQLSMSTKKAIEHYQEFKVVGCPYPFDGVMRSNWNIFSKAGL